MRVLSLVPSWTETLIRAGVEVCGRTRFCVHPANEVAGIPVVGGTKRVSWEKIEQIRPDLILLDKEENPKEFSEQNRIPWLATHVTSLNSCQEEMKKLGEHLRNAQLLRWAKELENLLKKSPLDWNFAQIPGMVENLRPPVSPDQKILYVIWEKPWMVINRGTYIESVLSFLGAPLATLDDTDKYPEVPEELVKTSFCLFSSEPFPFVEEKQVLKDAGYSGGLVDGECYSWFGLRSLDFLKTIQYKS